MPGTSSLAEQYFLAQHHGLPTRLLDWTENPLAALFFAVAGDGEHDAAVYALASRADIPGQEGRDVTDQDSPEVRQLVESLANQELCPREFKGSPLRIMPDMKAGRMLQQDSRFTLHPPGCDDIAPLVHKIIVKGEHRRRIRAQLRQYGVHQATLFPDLSNLISELRYQAGV